MTESEIRNGVRRLEKLVIYLRKLGHCDEEIDKILMTDFENRWSGEQGNQTNIGPGLLAPR